MSTTSEAIYYSDEEYSSDYSGSDLDVDDPHPFGNNTRRTIQNGKPKERIRRTGKVPLNLTRNYGLKSGWGMSQGFRELIQNLYKHSFRFCCRGLIAIAQITFVRIPTDRQEKSNGSMKLVPKETRSTISPMRKDKSRDRIDKRVCIISQNHWDILSFGEINAE